MVQIKFVPHVCVLGPLPCHGIGMRNHAFANLEDNL